MKAEDDIRVAKIEAKNQLEGVVYQLTELARSIGKTSVRGVGNCLSSCACKICVSLPPLLFFRLNLLALLLCVPGSWSALPRPHGTGWRAPFPGPRRSTTHGVSRSRASCPRTPTAECSCGCCVCRHTRSSC